MRRLTIAIGLVSLILPPAAAATIYVNAVTGNDAWSGLCETWDGGICGPKRTINAGIFAAVTGDTILLADGVYQGSGNGNLNFLGRVLTVRSASGNPSACIIDGVGAFRAFTFDNGEPAAAVVEGITIRNGWGNSGSGISCLSADPTIRNCVLENCRTSGAIYSQGGSPTIEDCTIRNNLAGGIRMIGGAGVIRRCTIEGNSGGEGAGIRVTDGAVVTVSDCAIRKNVSSGYDGGGGAYLVTGCILSNCRISDNVASGYGGGVFGSAEIDRCIIERNTAQYGGGFYGHQLLVRDTIIRGNRALGYGGGGRSSGRFENCVIRENWAFDGGGALTGANTLTNCTIVENATEYGSVISYSGDGSPPQITNCIVWNNLARGVTSAITSQAMITYSDIQGGFPGTGNINVDPGFAFAADMRLATSSPCINAGTASPPGGLSALDLDGNPRSAGAAPDMGAFEFQPLTPALALSAETVVLAAPLAGTGQVAQSVEIRNAGGGVLSWSISENCPWLVVDPPAGVSMGEVNVVRLRADGAALGHGEYICNLNVAAPSASPGQRTIVVRLLRSGVLSVPADHPTIQAAVDAAVDGDDVVLADGTYRGSGNRDIDFRGKAITVRSAGGVPADCIIDCEQAARGFRFENGEGLGSVLSGVTITNGRADSGAPYNPSNYGGAIRCFNFSSPLISNCVLHNNRARENGGAIAAIDSSPTIVHCTITGNQSMSTAGGGVSAALNTHILDCLFAENTAASSGGGVSIGVAGDGLRVERCTIRDNIANTGGGLSVYASENHTPAIRDNLIVNNTANSGGGGVHASVSHYSDDLPLTNLTIADNTAGTGGGLYVEGEYYGRATLRNCIVWGNTASSGAEAAVYGGFRCLVSATFSHSVIQNQEVIVVLECGDVVFGPGNIAADPLFVAPTNGDYHLQTGSPCIDTGDPAFVPAPGESDVDGQLRLWNGRVDMGADEFGSFGFGDVNCDAAINNFDIDAFILAVSDPAAFVAAYPDCERDLADANRDGSVDNFDIDSFVRLLAP